MIRATQADKETMARNILRMFGETGPLENCQEWRIAWEALARMSERRLTALYRIAQAAKL